MRIFLLVILSLSLLACNSSHQQEDTNNGKLRILTTTGIIGDAVKNIVGDSAIVESLMGPGVDPHLYRVSQGDLGKLTSASIIFYNGLHLEGKMGEVLGKLQKRKNTVAVSDGIPKDKLRNISGFSGDYDPHIWFDVAIWKYAVTYISQQIIKADSVHADFYEQNTQSYLASLDSLDRWVRDQISQIPEEQRVLITAHDAFGYFGDAYKIQVEGLQGISTMSEPGLRDIAQITDLIVERKIKAIFVESSVSQKTVKSVVEGAIAKGQEVRIGGTLYSDALGEPASEAGNYLGMVKTNVQTITSALGN
jgi:manganese/zinc/iron transport system substrate-binding protein